MTQSKEIALRPAQVIRGSGGGSSSSKGGGASESNNTLRSNATARLVELLSEGPIGGLVNGGMSIYFNNTPVVNADGTVNFRGVQWESRTGLPDQAVLLGNASAENIQSVELQVKYNIDSYVRTIDDPDATGCRIIVRVPSLSYTNIKTGAIGPASVVWAIDCKPNNGGWTQMAVVSLINQKCDSLYEQATYFDLPAGGYPWEVRVRRATADSDTVNLNNDTWWVSYTTIVAGQFTYPNSALVAVEVSADLFQQTSIPSRSYLIDGLKIQIPSNYDPFARTYTGVWDGTFNIAVCSNPAWVFYDLITNDRYGLGEFVDAATVDKWSLYQIAQYCDQLVPNGFGDWEPRYIFNGVINSRQEAYKVLQQITTTFRGMAYWSLGQVIPVADMPSDPVKLVSPANVIDGHFTYSGTALKARHSVAIISWNDPQDFYRPAAEVVINEDLLQQFGWRETSVTAFGCTSRGQAHRYGKWILDTEQHSTETVEYTAAWDHIDVRPGDVIAIADPNKAQARIGGRIVSNNGAGSYTLDGVFAATAGQTYNLMVELPDGVVGNCQIASFNGATVHLVGDFNQTVASNAMWVITGTDIEPRQYRIVSITEEDTHQFKVTALFYDPTKYARVEQNINLDPVPYSRPKTTINPPNNLQATESLYFQDGTAASRITLSWTPSDDFMALGYSVYATNPNGSKNNLGTVSGTSVDIDNAPAGQWVFSVATVGPNNGYSAPITLNFTSQGWAGTTPPYVSHLEVFNQGANIDFSGVDCHLDWQNNFPGSTTDAGQEDSSGAGTGLISPFYRDNVVRIYDVSTETLLRTEVVYTSDYIYTYDKNTADNVAFTRGPQRSFIVGVTVRDNLGRESAEVRLTPDNPVPDVILPTVTSGQECMYVDYVQPSDPDFVGAFIWASTDPKFDPTTTVPSYQGSNNFVAIPGVLDTTYYVRVAGYDQFGTSGLNISPPVQVVVGGFKLDTNPPDIPTNLVLGAGMTTLATGQVVATLSASWDASASSNFAYFDVELMTIGGSYISFQTATNSYMWTGVIPNQQYSVQVRAFSQNGFASAFCNAVLLTVPPKTTAPGQPTGLEATASLKSAYLQWTNPSDPDIDHIEIWSNNADDPNSATLVGTSFGTAFTQTGLTTGATYYYWVRAVNTSQCIGIFSQSVSVMPGQVANGDIAANAITADKITAGSITGNLLKIDTFIPPTITVGSTGVQIGDPAALINANNTTQISPGLINISGATTLASWRSGADATKIAGGSIAANSISANSLTIGLRGIAIAGLQFSFNTTTQALSWAAGSVSYMNDAGAQTLVNVAAGSITYSGSPIYVSWVKDATTLTTSTSAPSDPSTIQFAAYTVASGMVVTYGRTVIDGSSIVTGSIQANQIAAGTIQAQNIAAGAITATAIAAGAVTADKLNGGTINASSAINIGGTNFQINASNQNMTVKDTSGVTRLTIGQLSSGNYGISIYDATGAVILTSGSKIDASQISNLMSSGNMLYNSDFALGLVNVGSYTNVSGGTVTLGSNLSGHILPGGWNVYVTMATTLTSSPLQIFDLRLYGQNDSYIPVVPGTYYEASCYVGAYRCAVDMGIYWFDASGAYVSESHGAQAAANNGATGGLDTYLRPFVIAQAPATAVQCFVGPRGYGIGQANPYIFATRAYLGQATATQTTPSNWSMGGAGAVITSSNVSTYIQNAAIQSAQINTLNANQIIATSLSSISANIGAITAGTITGPSGYMLIDANNGYIVISDNS